MIKSSESRRTVVLGGMVAAGVVGPLAIAAATKETVLPVWSPAAVKRSQAEVTKWQKFVGRQFKIGGEFGTAPATLAAIVVGPPDAGRPASLGRATPFTLYFQMDPRQAPVGQKAYRVARADGSNFQFFLGRGVDKLGKAVVYALLN